MFVVARKNPLVSILTIVFIVVFALSSTIPAYAAGKSADLKGASVAGTGVIGAKLTAKPNPAKAAGLKYQWYYLNSEGKAKAISKATKKTYNVKPSDEGKDIFVKIQQKSKKKTYASKTIRGVTSSTYRIAKKINKKTALDLIQWIGKQGTNPKLGFRMSGSDAEKAVADKIVKSYKAMGLKPHVDKIDTDKFVFKNGVLKYDGAPNGVDISSYQTTFQTGGPKSYTLVYVGKGRSADYEKMKVSAPAIFGADGKFQGDVVVLSDTDQYNEFWINFQAYEAVKVWGAKAFISCENDGNGKPTGGYASFSDDQIQNNDICGPADAPALSVSRNTRKDLLSLIDKNKQGGGNGAINVTLDVDALVTPASGSQNIWVEIKGKDKGASPIIIMSHYDSYWRAALDDADGVGTTLTLAKALVESKYKPNRTIRIIHHGAEEWGIAGSIYDWASGAQRQITQVHPEWADSIFAAINVDSFTIQNNNPRDPGNKDMNQKVRINAPQLDSFAKDFIDKKLPKGYSIGRYDTTANNFFECFPYLISGVPKMLFTRTDYQSQLDTYHSSMDSYSYYTKYAKQDKIMKQKVQVVAAAVLAFDEALIQPLNYESFFTALNESIDKDAAAVAPETKAAVAKAEAKAKTLDKKIADINTKYVKAVQAGDKKTIKALKKKAKAVGNQTNRLYKYFQYTFTRLDHIGDVVPPHGMYQNNLEALKTAKAELAKATPDVKAAVTALGLVDSNDLAANGFSKLTYQQSVNQKTGQAIGPFPDRLSSADGRRIMLWGVNANNNNRPLIEGKNQDLYDVVVGLTSNPADTTAAKAAIDSAITDQSALLTQYLNAEKTALNASTGVTARMDAILKALK
ncbi:MAG: M28 family peptidase [Clostridiales Family XIII bacterium]|jgi:hypothetical protein|nr:M28 family peptidase [Clostridiales Family XIII bacterium]